MKRRTFLKLAVGTATAAALPNISIGSRGELLNIKPKNLIIKPIHKDQAIAVLYDHHIYNYNAIANGDAGAPAANTTKTVTLNLAEIFGKRAAETINKVAANALTP